MYAGEDENVDLKDNGDIVITSTDGASTKYVMKAEVPHTNDELMAHDQDPARAQLGGDADEQMLPDDSNDLQAA